MTGLEKMKSQILDEAKSSASDIIDRAQKSADAVKKEMREKAEAECGRISKKAEADVENIKERALSSCDLQKRKALLEAKQEVISEVLKNHTARWHRQMTRLISTCFAKCWTNSVLAQEGEICFSPEDLKRMPQGFEKEISDIAEKKGGKLVLSKEHRNIRGGFVLIYGGIEENCTFKAMFDSKRGELSDKVHALLFS